jgi:hypothetical protein
MAEPSGYLVQSSEGAPAVDEVAAEIARRGYRAFVSGDQMDETLAPESLRVAVQIGMEHLARLGGAETGDWATAEQMNRGLLVILRERDRFGTGQHP